MKDPHVRIDELEERIAFQEDTIQQLDDAMAAQQRQIMDLLHELGVLLEHVKKLESSGPQGAVEADEKPPHY